MKRQGEIWTNEEIDFLKKNYPKYGSEYCVSFLQRAKKTIIKRANILKIKFLGTRFKYSKENLEPIVKKSKHIKEVLENMNLRAAGGNYKVINNYIKKYNIDIAHFETASERIKKINKKKCTTPLVDILTENSTYSRASLKERLYKEGLKKHECEKCGQGEIWNGEKISLILDHKNGIHNDNRLENLRILCPNCNATLPTHAGKNARKNIIRVEKIKKDGRKNSRPKRRIVNRPSLQQLKNEVFRLGYSATGRKYGVSDNAIRKWIKTYEQYGI